MLEESILWIWVSVYSWFTPTVLFVLLNLVIGTIAITSRMGTRKQQQTQEETQPQLDRAPSLLTRFKSINLYRYRSGEVNPFPSVTTEMETQHTVEQTQEETVVQHPDHVSRMNSDTKPASGDMPVKLPQKMKKSASEKSAFGHFEEEENSDKRRPSTVREWKSKASELQRFGDDKEVDAKADDFINRFKQQLKLQRLDSILRYKEMLNRGAGK